MAGDPFWSLRALRFQDPEGAYQSRQPSAQPRDLQWVAFLRRRRRSLSDRGGAEALGYPTGGQFLSPSSCSSFSSYSLFCLLLLSMVRLLFLRLDNSPLISIILSSLLYFSFTASSLFLLLFPPLPPFLLFLPFPLLVLMPISSHKLRTFANIRFSVKRVKKLSVFLWSKINT